MPRLVTITRDVFLVFKIAENEAVLGELFVDLCPDLGVLHHVLVEVNVLTVYVKIEIERKTRVML